jgi:hypothetical protein
VDVSRKELDEAIRVRGSTMDALAERVKEALAKGEAACVVEQDGCKQELIVECDNVVNWISGFRNCQDCSRRPELFKLKDNVWASAGLNHSDVVCISCFEKRLGRELSEEDADVNFPWWQAERPEYYEGFVAGLTGHSDRPIFGNPPEFDQGSQVGSMISKILTYND